MSSLPDRPSQPPNSSPSDVAALTEPPKTMSNTNRESSANSSSNPADASDASSSPILNRPPMRPVHRPQPPTSTPATPAKPTAVADEPAGMQNPVIAQDSASQPQSSDSALAAGVVRPRPIPPPSEPKQFRAIGLLRGRYVPSEEKFTRGEMVTTDGTVIEAVLLGRVMSLVRNHLDLEKEHLWVVYPRTREQEEQHQLHVQIVGVWEPETLSKNLSEADNLSDAATTSDNKAEWLDPGVEVDYFSVRGEIVFYSEENEDVIVKIHQSSKKDPEKAKSFKLKLQGPLVGGKAVGYFWDLHVKRTEADLIITEANCIGLAPPRKRPKDAMPGRSRPPGRRPTGPRTGPRTPRMGGSTTPPVRREPPQKPIKPSDTTNQ